MPQIQTVQRTWDNVTSLHITQKSLPFSNCFQISSISKSDNTDPLTVLKANT